jgi:DNA-nicking Smr family endonuclease
LSGDEGHREDEAGRRERSRSDDRSGTRDTSPGEASSGDVDRAVEIPITGDLDLHPFSPRDIPSIVEEYVQACRERGILEVRLAHGKGTGVQRAVVQRVLRSTPAVISFWDAPSQQGGWGATIARLRPPSDE